MAPSTFVSIFILALTTGVLSVAWQLNRRVHIGDDFVLARRRLPAVLTGLSHGINCVPLWLTLALMYLAYSIGLAAGWMALALLFGMAINWWLIAPYLRSHTAATGSETLSRWFASSAGDNLQSATLHSSASIVVFSLGLASVTCLQWAAQFLAPLIGSNFTVAIALIMLVVLAIALLAGMWSTSTADALQMALILFAIGTLTIAILFAVDDWQALISGLLQTTGTVSRKSRGYFGGYSGVLAISLVVGMTFAAFGGSAQPHAISRYLACRDAVALRRARWVAIACCALTLIGALSVGWCARVLVHSISTSRALLLTLAEQTLPTTLANVVIACIAIAFALSSASPWVAIATHVVTDLRTTSASLSLFACRIALVVIGMSIAAAAIYFPVGSEDRLWLCWQSLSAAFGPLLFVRLTGKKVRPGSALGAMWSGFILTVLFHLMPDTPGDLLERTLPFIAALGIALSGGERRRNPDRADRGDKTVHDHLPI